MSENREFALFLLGLSGVFVFLLIKGYREGILEDEADEDGTPGAVATREDTPGAFWRGLGFFAVMAAGCLVAGVYAWNHDLRAAGRSVAHGTGQWLILHATVHGAAALILVPGIIALPGILTLLVTLGSYAWPSVKGRIEYLTYERTLREGENSHTVSLNQIWTLTLVYTYVVAGREFSGTRIRPLGFNSAKAERTLARRFKQGAEIDVYYCPAWRSLSCVERGGVGRALVLACLCGVIIYGLARAGLWD